MKHTFEMHTKGHRQKSSLRLATVGLSLALIGHVLVTGCVGTENRAGITPETSCKKNQQATTPAATTAGVTACAGAENGTGTPSATSCKKDQQATTPAPVAAGPIELSASFESPVNKVLPTGSETWITVKAQDDSGIKKVALYVDGQWKYTRKTSPYIFQLKDLAPGHHELKAWAFPVVETTPHEKALAVQNLTIASATGNLPPTITKAAAADPLSSTEPGKAVKLSVVASDPEAQPLSFTWSDADATGKVTFTDAGQASTNATFTEAGEYNLKIEVKDGELTTSDLVKVTVAPESGPVELSVSFEMPAEKKLPASASTWVKVKAQDDSGIKKVALYVDDEWKYTDKTAPYIFELKDLPAGDHELKVWAFPVTEEMENEKAIATRDITIMQSAP